MTDEKEYQVQEIPDPGIKSFREMMLYKMDRTLAIVGIIALGAAALFTASGNDPITMAAISGLVGYVGGRSAK